ncbi:copper transporter 6-like [Elaeis guineensis]|uniref:Copper transport protein n=1 Tax=Elaeis guineensis var. tenera TaxID=51953 RepID=A0A6I9QQN0_ELAGV|nr:copper transporter 6-like [Elaeis guineensis]
MDHGMGDMGHGMAPMGDMGQGMGDMGGAGMGDMHMTFFWGKNAQILFSGWPGNRGGMYALALIVVFVLAVLLEWFNHGRVISPRWSRVVAGLALTAMHALRVGLAYVVMLAVMSFNVGVLIAVILGHAVGFLLFYSSVFKRPPPPANEEFKGYLPPMACSC